MAIDLAVTKQNIKDKYGNISKFKKTTPFEHVTVDRFLKVGIGPIAAIRPDSVSQKIARYLRAEGLLAESPDSGL